MVICSRTSKAPAMTARTPMPPCIGVHLYQTAPLISLTQERRRGRKETAEMIEDVLDDVGEAQ